MVKQTRLSAMNRHSKALEVIVRDKLLEKIWELPMVGSKVWIEPEFRYQGIFLRGQGGDWGDIIAQPDIIHYSSFPEPQLAVIEYKNRIHPNNFNKSSVQLAGCWSYLENYAEHLVEFLQRQKIGEDEIEGMNIIFSTIVKSKGGVKEMSQKAFMDF
jgi:hypothetical protein